AICKHLVDLMQGSINFRSEEGVGTTFSLKLKLACDAKRTKVITQLKNADMDIVVLGQNHFHNTVIEHYINAMGRNVYIVARIQSWLDLLNEFPNRSCLTICTDFDLLGDLAVLKDKLKPYSRTIDLICFTSQSESSLEGLEALKPVVN